MSSISDLKIKLFADGADKQGMLQMNASSFVQGFTTNPTLMRQAGVKDYKSFALDILNFITDKPVSFEVFADDFVEMERQAYEIASWSSNVVVKIPVTNTKGEFAGPLIKRLSFAGVALNVTALFTFKQVRDVAACLSPDTSAIVSVFAGRLADTGVNPVSLMEMALHTLKTLPKAELLWASTRELFNIFQANDAGCHIITVPPDLLNKLNLFGKNLDEYSLDTVKMFYKDAVAAGFDIPVAEPA